jgi:outer membrane protein W
MKRVLAAVALAAVAGVATPARAADDTGVSLALRAGVGLPMGNAEGGTPSTSLADIISTGIPVQVDAGYRFTRNIFAGAYFQYGFASINNDKAFGGGVCNTPGVSCSARNLRFGIEGIYSFMPDSVFAPWAGVGFGYEIAKFSASYSGFNLDGTTKGLEFLNLQIGGDYKVSPMFSVGPYASFSLASYSSASQDTNIPGAVNGDIPGFQSGTHEWLQFGFKGTFNL